MHRFHATSVAAATLASCTVATFALVAAPIAGAANASTTPARAAHSLSTTSSTAASAVAASHGSMAYVTRAGIYIARVDGSHPHLVKKGSFYWPSQGDKGTIAAEAFDGHTAPDGSRGVSIYRFSRAGKRLSRTATPADYSTFDCPRYAPDHVSLSPNGTKLAFDFWLCDEFTTAWTPATKLSFKGEGAGQEGYHASAWTSSTKLVTSHIGVRIAGGKEIGTFSTSSGQNHVKDWLNADAWASGFSTATTRDGKHVAILEDDAANYFDGVARHVKLELGTASGVGAKVSMKCRVTIPATAFKAWSGTSTASLSFAPDGSRVVFDAPKGSWLATTSKLSSCSSVKAHLWKKGVWDVSFSPAKAMS